MTRMSQSAAPGNSHREGHVVLTGDAALRVERVTREARAAQGDRPGGNVTVLTGDAALQVSQIVREARPGDVS